MKSSHFLLAAVAIAAAGIGAEAWAAESATPQLNLPSLCNKDGSALVISSDEGCVRVTGGVSYTYQWGNAPDYGNLDGPGTVIARTPAGNYTIPTPTPVR